MEYIAMKRIVGGFRCRALLHWLVLAVLGIALPAFGCASSEEKLLDQLRSNPLEAPEAVAWFDSLPLKEKREWAAKLGHIVLESRESSGFVVAFGADREPYPWALVVHEEGLRLSGKNSFKYVYRDDEEVKDQWGVHWVYHELYNTDRTDGRVVFRRNRFVPWSEKEGSGGWIPATSWRYVGPELPKFAPKSDEARLAIAAIRKLGGLVPIDESLDEYQVVSVVLPYISNDDALRHVKHLPELRELYVHGPKTTDAGLEHLRALTNLRLLCLESPRVTDEGLMNLSAMTRLRNLEIRRARLVTGSGLKSLERMVQLEELDLFGTEVSDESLAHLANLTELQKLDLGLAKISDAGLAHLAHLTKLRSLDMSRASVTDAGLRHLEGLTDLRTLRLSGRGITNGGLTSLQRMTKLETLALTGSGITDAGLRELREFKHLKHLDVRGSQVTNRGIDSFQFAHPDCKVLNGR